MNADKANESNKIQLKVSETNTTELSKESNEYSAKKRDPLFANANSTYLWELVKFK